MRTARLEDVARPRRVRVRVRAVACVCLLPINSIAQTPLTPADLHRFDAQ